MKKKQKKQQKKQNMLTAIIIILMIALTVMVASIVYEEIINMKTNSDPVQNPTIGEQEKVQENLDEDKDNGNIIEQEKVEEKEDEKNNTVDETNKEEQYVGEEEQEDTKVDTAKSKNEKAINLAKKEWGEDDSVTFTIEETNGTKYYIAVKSDATVIQWYEVDTETWKISEY